MNQTATLTPPLRPACWFSGFIVLLVLMPLPFGANRPWASDLFALLTASLALGMAWRVSHDPLVWPHGAPWRRLGVSAVLLSLAALWAFLQTQSWMPKALHHPIWESVKDLPGAHKGSISVEPDLFAESLARFLSYIACFLLAFFGGRDAEQAKKMLKALAAAAAVYAFYGLLMQSTGLRFVLWFPKWTYQEFVTSTFVNKNSYATYAALGLQCGLVLLWQRLKHRSHNGKEARTVKEWLEKIGMREIIYFLGCLLVLGALLLSGSRAGMFSALAGCFALLLALAANRGWRWTRIVPVAAVGIALLLGLMTFGSTILLERLDQSQVEAATDMRLAGYAIAVRAITSNLWLGYGLGSFDSAFHLFSDPTVKLWLQHAHNDYLELALELGVPAALMVLTAILLMVSCCAGGVRKRRRHEIYAALALSASVTVGVHAFFDFSLQMPAIAATYAALLGLGVAQSWSSRKDA